MGSSSQRSNRTRSWYLDAVSAATCTISGIALARLFRMVPFLALFALIIFCGIGYYFARSAWRGLLDQR